MDDPGGLTDGDERELEKASVPAVADDQQSFLTGVLVLDVTYGVVNRVNDLDIGYSVFTGRLPDLRV